MTLDKSRTPDLAGGSADFQGSNQSGLRDYNERLVLSMIQRSGGLPGVDIARRAGLSAQTVSVILRSLEADGLLMRGAPQRGKVGKPSIPMKLNPTGVYSIGLKIGRRSTDLILTDFNGAIVARLTDTYAYPMPDPLLAFVKEGVDKFRTQLGKKSAARIIGIGVAKPFEIWNWHETIGAPEDEMNAWKALDFEVALEEATSLPIYLENDATAACRAEHIYGRSREFSSFAYLYIGSFIGGGVVLNNSVYDGANGNAGAFGSLPIVDREKGEGQLIDTASLYMLERELEAQGVETTELWSGAGIWDTHSVTVGKWIERIAPQLARAAVTCCAVIDFEAVIIDGAFPTSVREKIVSRTREEMTQFDMRGIVRPRIMEGSIGWDARPLGAASAPVYSEYLLNRHGALSHT